MIYNDGQVHTDFYDKEVDKIEIAKQFSEGDIQLQDCLLKLWEKGIKTLACCRGHGDTSIAYISLVFDENSSDLIYNICDYMYFSEEPVELDFSNHKDYDSVSIDMPSERSKHQWLDFISKCANNQNYDFSFSTAIPTTAMELLAFANREGLSCRYSVNKDEMMFGYCQPGVLQVFGDNALQLDDIIDDIKTKGELPLAPISCNENSIGKFLNLISSKTAMEEKLGKKF